MGDKSKISWVKSDEGIFGATWNPVRGCSRISDGCRNCYAERSAIRQVHGAHAGFVKSTENGPRWTGKVALVPERILQPMRWRRPRRIFVNSMSDLFHEDLPMEAIDAVLAGIALAPQHTFLVLTKRAERMREYFARTHVGQFSGQDVVTWPHSAYAAAVKLAGETAANLAGWSSHNRPLRNLWLGVSAEDQRTYDERVPPLLETPAAIRFVSLEPLLEPLNLRGRGNDRRELCVRCGLGPDDRHDHADGYRTRGLDWFIVGGESGPHARACNLQWVRAIAWQCQENEVPLFVKQLGSHPFYDCAGRAMGPRVILNDRKGEDPDEWPEDLRIRQFPTPASSS